ncbi:MAG: FHA domain-containing protein [Deltaproteobacteria bacterium]|nr:FHA domain-containing protein [Deltaproteobacteria bacterium]
MKIVIDHVRGSRRGQRQELPADRRVRFGRHPECEVSFDALRDIDASSRHAELRPGDVGWTLVDVGSSNGTYVEGHRVTEVAVAAGAPVTVEFGAGGPRLRVFVGDEAMVAALPAPELPPPPRRFPWAIVAAAAVAVALALVIALR